MSNDTTHKLNYIPGLDGIRAVAALLVIATHWPDNHLSLAFGWIGVNIFFVLSGFLITRILVNEKGKALTAYLAKFFYRRILRIMPVYYLFFTITALLILLAYYSIPLFSTDPIITKGIAALKYDTPFYLSYLYNIKLNLAGYFKWPNYPTLFFGHVWSLAVEEQFYLVFPFIVYFSSSFVLKKILIAVIIICPLIRLWMALVGIHIFTDKLLLGQFGYMNTFCQADAFAAGGLLAVLPLKLRSPYHTFFRIILVCLIVGCTCFYFLRKAGYDHVEAKSFGFDFPLYWYAEQTKWFLINIRSFYQFSLVNLFAVALIAPATINKPLFPRLLQARPMIYLGKISYGIYLFHVPILAFLMLIAPIFGGWTKLILSPLSGIAVFLLYLGIVITLAHLSYKYFEQKIIYKYKFAIRPPVMSKTIT